MCDFAMGVILFRKKTGAEKAVGDTNVTERQSPEESERLLEVRGKETKLKQ